jgi:Leucine-rich repeat (LRR) protein
MIRNFIRLVFAFLAISILLFVASFALSESLSFKNYKEALEYVKTNQPNELDIGTVRMKPSELLSLLSEMPAGSELHFRTKRNGVVISSDDDEFSAKDISGSITLEDIECLISIMPNLKKVDVSNVRKFSNDVMIPFIEKYPDISFNWHIVINSHHSLSSWNTAYSSYNEPNETVKITSEQAELFRYAPGLKALDLGHNNITSVEFLNYLPDLEFLILGDNPIEDCTPIGNLLHLKYLELFSVNVTDISPLSSCTELLDINLSHNQEITDLSPLDSASKMERFWGNKMHGISEEEELRFISMHPEAKIIFHGAHATSDGWREHERYDHYRWCFRHHKWISFGNPLVLDE